MTTEFNTVKDIVDYGAKKFKDADFVRFFRGDEMCAKSFNQFRDDCYAVCRYIRALDGNKHHIAFLGKTSYEYIAGLTGMILSGNVVIPFDPNITVEEAVMLFDDGDVDMLFCEEENLAKAEEIKSKFSGLHTIISLGDWKWFEDLYVKYSATSEYAELSKVKVDPDEMSLIIYTSGTTGVRKGVMLTNHNLAANTTYKSDVSNTKDIGFTVLPMHHVFCYACDVLRNLYDGTVVCLNGKLTDMYKNFLAFQPTVMRIVPALCKSILTKIKIAEKRNPGLTKRECADLVVGKNFTKMIVGSAFISAAMIDELEKYGIMARMGYGMSECSPRITTIDWVTDQIYCTGKLLGTDRVRIQDGEVQVKGPSVMKGYYKKPEATAEAFTEDGYLHTGDLGMLRDDHLYLLGRKKNIIVLSNGENISPEEIENKFVDDSIIKELLVVADDDKLMAEIVLNKDLTAELSEEEINGSLEKIIDRVNTELPTDKHVYGFKIRETPFPRTSTGKIKRTYFKY